MKHLMNRMTLGIGLLMVAGTVASPALSLAGPGSSGGGGAHVCRNGDKSIRSIELYDLYEGHARYEFKGQLVEFADRDTALKTAYQTVRGQEMASLSAKIEAAVTLLKKHIELTDKKLVPSIDANKVMVDEGCEYEQVAYWDNRTEKVFVNRTLYNQMSPANQAALYAHEAIYWLARTYSKETTSDDTRELVARIFLGEKIITAILGLRTYISTSADLTGSNSYLTLDWTEASCYDFDLTGPKIDLINAVVTRTFGPLNKKMRNQDVDLVLFDNLDPQRILPEETVQGKFSTVLRIKTNAFYSDYGHHYWIKISKPNCPDTYSFGFSGYINLTLRR